MCCSISSAATWWGSWWPAPRTPGWPARSSRRPATNTASRAGTSTLRIRTAAAPCARRPPPNCWSIWGVAASYSRPRVSNDNPFLEAQFKTLKYRPEFPERFDGIEHTRAHLREFFTWYNDEHRHSGIGFMTPAAVHFGQAAAMQRQRATVLAAAYRSHPQRFKENARHHQRCPRSLVSTCHHPNQRIRYLFAASKMTSATC